MKRAAFELRGCSPVVQEEKARWAQTSHRIRTGRDAADHEIEEEPLYISLASY